MLTGTAQVTEVHSAAYVFGMSEEIKNQGVVAGFWAFGLLGFWSPAFFITQSIGSYGRGRGPQLGIEVGF
jgi:hypothetical protein